MKNTKINLKSLGKERLIKSPWISLRELFKFLNFTMWIFEEDNQKKYIQEFGNRVRKLWLRSGSNFTFLYLKECYRLCIRFLIGSPEVDPLKRGVYVKRDSFGIPSIIPIELRHKLMDRKNLGVKFILTLISIYRVFPTVQRPKFGTIISPFGGTNRTLEFGLLRRAYADLQLYKVSSHIPAHRLIHLESSSPMTIKSSWGSSIDLIALMHNPHHYFLVMWGLLYSLTGILIFIWIFLLSILGLIPALITYCVFGQFTLGRLAVVKDQAGKGRIVAMANYWIQLSLKPLHKFLFSILRGIEQDGTHDQRKPLLDLINKIKDNKIILTHKFSCFDLSAATDRLPIEIQMDVLKILLGSSWSSWWKSILDITWLYESRKVKYSVGQPMGAYTSFAMLGLTHHFIVRCAALIAGVKDFKDYCILGDDIVIYHDNVAEQYSKIMESLGLELNPSKSVISPDFAEFAKVLIGPKVDFSPLGSGIITRTIRDKGYFGAFIAECFKQNVLSEYSALLRVLGKLKGFKTQKYLGLWSVFGLNGADMKASIEDARSLERAITIMWPSARTDAFKLPYYVLNAVRQVRLDMLAENMRSTLKNLNYFNKHWFYTSVLNLRLLDNSSYVNETSWLRLSDNEIFSNIRHLSDLLCGLDNKLTFRGKWNGNIPSGKLQFDCFDPKRKDKKVVKIIKFKLIDKRTVLVSATKLGFYAVRSLLIFESVSRIVSPGFWVVWFRFLNEIKELCRIYIYLNWKIWNPTFDNILELLSDRSLNMTSIDWRDKEEVKRVSRFALHIRAYSLIYKANYEIHINDNFCDWAFTLLLKKSDIESLNSSLIYWGSEPLKPISVNP
jgi:hypothetical protein